jgi:glycosyltransferase involved in cell wall biosynthesis
MRIAFIDASRWDFNVDTPWRQALGGTQSAAAYLAVALAAAGHEVFFITATTAPGAIRGVRCLSTRSFAPTALPALKPDVTIMIVDASAGPKLRELLGSQAKLVLWVGHAADQPGVLPLKDPSVQDAFNAIALVSDWQRDQFIRAFNIPPQRTALLRYAVAPPFLGRFKPGESIVAAKTRPPVLAYTSTPFRGLDVLLRVFPEIRQRVPDVRLKVFSAMSIYLATAEEDQSQYGHLYQLCRQTQGVEYMGAVSQPDLAEELSRVAVLAYSNTFAETSCISVLEAMASGCSVVTSALGALPETAAGFAKLIPIDSSIDEYQRQFVDATVQTLAELERPQTDEHLARQVQYVADNYDWNQRAQQAAGWFSEL